MNDCCVANDLVEVLDRQVGDGLVLVERVGAADTPHGYSCQGGAVREIGVLATVSAVKLTERIRTA
jgi:hypothetical protein